MVKQGDIIWLNFDPQAGHEQKGRRPALVISNHRFAFITKKAAIVCPITNTNRNLPFHVLLDSRTKTIGVILCDQPRAMDLDARNYAPIERAPEDILDEVLDIVAGLVEKDD